MTKLVRYDEAREVRAELNQDAIARTAADLLAGIDAAVESSPEWAGRLESLRAYACAGIAGQITAPRTWAEEPLAYEFGEGLLPGDVGDLYGEFTFWTHGLTFDEPVVQMVGGVAYITVDD